MSAQKGTGRGLVQKHKMTFECTANKSFPTWGCLPSLAVQQPLFKIPNIGDSAMGPSTRQAYKLYCSTVLGLARNFMASKRNLKVTKEAGGESACAYSALGLLLALPGSEGPREISPWRGRCAPLPVGLLTTGEVGN